MPKSRPICCIDTIQLASPLCFYNNQVCSTEIFVHAYIQLVWSPGVNVIEYRFPKNNQTAIPTKLAITPLATRKSGRMLTRKTVKTNITATITSALIACWRLLIRNSFMACWFSAILAAQYLFRASLRLDLDSGERAFCGSRISRRDFLSRARCLSRIFPTISSIPERKRLSGSKGSAEGSENKSFKFRRVSWILILCPDSNNLPALFGTN